MGFISKAKFNYDLRIDDVCDINGSGDGLTPRFYFAVYNMNLNVGYSAIKGQDGRGCSASPGVRYIDSQSWPQNIKRAQVVIELSYQGQPGNIANASDPIGNPYT